MIIKKQDLNLLIDHLIERYEVFAPVGRTFERIQSSKEVDIKRKTAFSARKLFFPNKETIFTVKGSKAVPAVEKTNG